MSELALIETLRHAHGRCAFRARHFARLERSARALGFAWPPRGDPARALSLAGRAFGGTSCALRMRLARDGEFAVESRAIDVPPGEGVALAVVSDPRLPEPAQSSFKTSERALYDEARAAARARGARDALLLACDGSVVESSIANLFVARGGRLATSDLALGGLPGVARGALLDALEREGIDCETRRIELDELARADELFLTNAVQGVLPVNAVLDLAPARPGALGPLTARCRELLERAAREEP